MKIPEISIKAEPLFHVLGFNITNSLISSVIVTLLFVGIALYYNSQLKADHKSLWFYMLDKVFRMVYGLFEGVTKEKTMVFFPLLGSFFFFIILQNWFGLLPGVGSIGIYEGEKLVPILRGGNADLNTTLLLGVISVIMAQVFGVRFLGAKAVFQKYFNFSSPINFYVGILEILSEISRILSFSFRLFGNVFAGEVLLVIIASLVPVLVSFPFVMMELFVGFIQALVFSLLSAVVFNSATTKHH